MIDPAASMLTGFIRDAKGVDFFGFEIYIGKKTIAVSDYIYPTIGAAEQMGEVILSAIMRSAIYDEIING